MTTAKPKMAINFARTIAFFAVLVTSVVTYFGVTGQLLDIGRV